MANKLISQMGLPKSIGNILAARNILTAKDALSLTEFELMELLDVGLSEVTSAVALISEIACPPYQTALSLMQERVQNEYLAGHLPTRLKGLDEALLGGVPFGAVTELVGPAGIGKTQFCLKLSLLAALPANYGGLNGRVIYIDTESKFSSRRMIEIGATSFPEIFHLDGMAQEMAGRILVLRPASLPEFTENLEQIKLSLLQHQVKLLIIDSMTALVSGESDKDLKASKQHPLGWHISYVKSLAEFSRIPIVVTNQVRSQNSNESFHYPFQVWNNDESMKDLPRMESHLVAALGIHWAHAVTIRLVLEAHSGKRFIKVAKSPVSPSLAFPFVVTSSGISLVSDDGIEIPGPEISAIHCQGNGFTDLRGSLYRQFGYIVYCFRAALRAKTARGVLLMEVTQVEDGFFCSKGWLREQFLMMLFIESTVQHLRDQNDVLNFEWRSTERQSSTLKELVNDCYGTLLDAQLYYTSWSCPTRKLAQQFFQTSRLSVNWISETFLRLII